MLLDDDFVLFIIEPYFPDPVLVLLQVGLCVEKRLEIVSHVTGQGVPEDKETVGLAGTSGENADSVGRSPVIIGRGGANGAGAGLDPHEFPVVIQVILGGLAIHEGCVLTCTGNDNRLGVGRGSDSKAQQGQADDEQQNAISSFFLVYVLHCDS